MGHKRTLFSFPHSLVGVCERLVQCCELCKRPWSEDFVCSMNTVCGTHRTQLGQAFVYHIYPCNTYPMVNNKWYDCWMLAFKSIVSCFSFLVGFQRTNLHISGSWNTSLANSKQLGNCPLPSRDICINLWHHIWCQFVKQAQKKKKVWIWQECLQQVYLRNHCWVH